jgi:hypothetical protein
VGERAHGFLERRVGIGAVRIEDVDVVEAQAAEALVETMSSSRCAARSAWSTRAKVSSAVPGGGP